MDLNPKEPAFLPSELIREVDDDFYFGQTDSCPLGQPCSKLEHGFSY